MRAHLFASLFATTAVSTALAYDHYDPASLNELAQERMRQGDLMTACILLHRAVRLAPYDVRTVANMRVLEAHLAGAPAPPTTAAPPAAQPPVAPQRTPAEIPPAPPALWAPK